MMRCLFPPTACALACGRREGSEVLDDFQQARRHHLEVDHCLFDVFGQPAHGCLGLLQRTGADRRVRLPEEPFRQDQGLHHAAGLEDLGRHGGEPHFFLPRVPLFDQVGANPLGGGVCLDAEVASAPVCVRVLAQVGDGLLDIRVHSNSHGCRGVTCYFNTIFFK